MVVKTLEDIEKAQFFFLKETKGTKKKIMSVINVNVLVGES
jgi:hypothetical protein